MQKFVLASGNPGKLQEFQSLLNGKDVEFVPQTDFDMDEADEDGLSFIENAIIKARHACAMTRLPAIADDSGLEVDALNGEPGIYSARYADIEGDRHSRDEANNRKLLDALIHVPEELRAARFQCAVALVRYPNDPMPLICQGTWKGRILFTPRGANGFGYDPLFFVPTHDCSSAELEPAEKNRISHRGQALRQLLSHWHR